MSRISSLCHVLAFIFFLPISSICQSYDSTYIEDIISYELAYNQKLIGEQAFINQEKEEASLYFSKAYHNQKFINPINIDKYYGELPFGLNKQKLLAKDIEYRQYLLEKKLDFWGYNFTYRPINPFDARDDFNALFTKFSQVKKEIDELYSHTNDLNTEVFERTLAQEKSNFNKKINDLKSNRYGEEFTISQEQLSILDSRMQQVIDQQKNLNKEYERAEREIDELNKRMNEGLLKAVATPLGVPPNLLDPNTSLHEKLLEYGKSSLPLFEKVAGEYTELREAFTGAYDFYNQAKEVIKKAETLKSIADDFGEKPLTVDNLLNFGKDIMAVGGNSLSLIGVDPILQEELKEAIENYQTAKDYIEEVSNTIQDPSLEKILQLGDRHLGNNSEYEAKWKAAKEKLLFFQKNRAKIEKLIKTPTVKDLVSFTKTGIEKGLIPIAPNDLQETLEYINLYNDLHEKIQVKNISDVIDIGVDIYAKVEELPESEKQEIKREIKKIKKRASPFLFALKQFEKGKITEKDQYLILKALIEYENETFVEDNRLGRYCLETIVELLQSDRSFADKDLQIKEQSEILNLVIWAFRDEFVDALPINMIKNIMGKPITRKHDKEELRYRLRETNFLELSRYNGRPSMVVRYDNGESSPLIIFQRKNPSIRKVSFKELTERFLKDLIKQSSLEEKVNDEAKKLDKKLNEIRSFFFKKLSPSNQDKAKKYLSKILEKIDNQELVKYAQQIIIKGDNMVIQENAKKLFSFIKGKDENIEKTFDSFVLGHAFLNANAAKIQSVPQLDSIAYAKKGGQFQPISRREFKIKSGKSQLPPNIKNYEKDLLNNAPIKAGTDNRTELLPNSAIGCAYPMAGIAVSMVKNLFDTEEVIDELHRIYSEKKQLQKEYLRYNDLKREILVRGKVALYEKEIAEQRLQLADSRVEQFKNRIDDLLTDKDIINNHIKLKLPLLYYYAEQLRFEYSKIDRALQFWFGNSISEIILSDPDKIRFAIDPEIDLYNWLPRISDTEARRTDFFEVVDYWEKKKLSVNAALDELEENQNNTFAVHETAIPIKLSRVLPKHEWEKLQAWYEEGNRQETIHLDLSFGNLQASKYFQPNYLDVKVLGLRLGLIKEHMNNGKKERITVSDIKFTHPGYSTLKQVNGYKELIQDNKSATSIKDGYDSAALLGNIKDDNFPNDFGSENGSLNSYTKRRNDSKADKPFEGYGLHTVWKITLPSIGSVYEPNTMIDGYLRIQFHAREGELSKPGIKRMYARVYFNGEKGKAETPFLIFSDEELLEFGKLEPIEIKHILESFEQKELRDKFNYGTNQMSFDLIEFKKNEKLNTREWASENTIQQ